MRRLAAALGLGATLLVAGCGQKGPLYLPDKNVRVITTPQAQPPPKQPAPEQATAAQPAPQQSGAAPPSAAVPQSASPVPPQPEDKNGDSEAPKQPRR